MAKVGPYRGQASTHQRVFGDSAVVDQAMVVSITPILIFRRHWWPRGARRTEYSNRTEGEGKKDLLGTRCTDHRSRPRQLLPQPMIVLLQPPELELMHRRLVCSARHFESGEDGDV